jgi:hypothetical protein
MAPRQKNLKGPIEGELIGLIYLGTEFPEFLAAADY